MIDIIKVREATPEEKIKWEKKQKENKNRKSFSEHLQVAMSNIKNNK